MALSPAEQQELAALEKRFGGGTPSPAPSGGGLSAAESAELAALESKQPAPGIASRLGGAAMRGGGSPLGTAVNLGAEGMKIGGEAIDRAAYKAGGAVTDLTGSPGAGLAANVAVQAVPTFIGGGAGKAAGEKAVTMLRDKGRKFMQEALKPDKAARESGDATKAVQTMLDKGINVSVGGVEKLRSEINSLNDQIKDAIQKSSATINKDEVAKRLDGLKDKFMAQVNPEADVATIKNAFDQFLRHDWLKGMADMPVQIAQKMKQGTYKILGDKAYGELKSAETEAQKALARGLKEEIAKAVPGINSLNQAESELLNAEALALSRAMQAGNNNALGLAALVLHNPKAAVTFLMDRSPVMKSLIARATYASAVPAPAAGTALGAAAGGAAGAMSGSEPTAADLSGAVLP